FRSAFVVNFLFAAIAVLAAAAGAMFLPIDAEHEELPLGLGLVLLEIALISLMIVNTWLGGRWRWHRRWFEAREMAERLRIALPLWVLGLRPKSFPGEEATWTGWYVRAMVRVQGMRSGDLAGVQFEPARGVLLDVLRPQSDYNIGN